MVRFYSDGKYKFLCFAAVFAALIDFFKPVGIMFLIAFFCVEIFLKIPEWKKYYKKWAVFLFVFLAVYGAGHAIVRAEIRRVFHTETVSSTGMYMAFAWSTDESGNYDINPVFEKFDYLMDKHNNDQSMVMEEMRQFAREAFSRANVPRVLWQKARLTFGDEGVLGWVLHSADEEYSAAAHRVLGGVLWRGFTVHVFFVMFLAAVGAACIVRKNENRRVLAFLLTTMIGYTLVLLLGVVQARYRLLLYPQLSVFAAVGVVWITELVYGKVCALKLSRS
jgi:hypothetical protein